MRYYLFKLIVALYQYVILAQWTTLDPKLQQYLQFLSQQEKDKLNYDPSAGFEPYWPGGDWLLKDQFEGSSTTKMVLVCGEECNYLYRRIKQVCAYKLERHAQLDGCWKSWIFFWWKCTGEQMDDHTKAYITFSTYCEFLDAQCSSPNLDQSWVLVHEGPCASHSLFKPIDKWWQLPERLDSHVKQVNKAFVNVTSKPFVLPFK